MRGHHQLDLAVDGGAKWNQLDGANSAATVFENRSSMVGVAAGIAVSREMLCCGSHPGILQAANESCAKTCHQLWVFTEGTRSNHRITWVAVDVAHQSEIDIDPQRRQFPAGGLSHFVRQLF